MALERLRLGLLALFLILLSFPAAAQTITDINIQGLKRTKPYVILEKLEKFRGIDAADFDKSQLETELQKTQLFSNIDASVSGSTLNVTVEEKFALLPIPFAYATSDSWGGGLIVMDSNAFGIMDQAAAGGFISSSSWRVLASYNHTQKEHSPFGWNISTNGGKSTTTAALLHGSKALSAQA